jgi:hypothetical protein
MSINVYWASLEKEWLRAEEPEPIYKGFIKDINFKDGGTALQYCPAVKDYMKNTFSLKSIYDYNFKIMDNENNVMSNLYDQRFLNEHVTVRSKVEKVFSFTQEIVFFTEEKSLNMSAGILPFLEDNNITKRCRVIPGTVDIGRWFRIIDFAFYLKKDYDSFEIEEGEIFQYLKFDTKDKIIFKQFRANEKLKSYTNDTSNVGRNRLHKSRILETYYSKFNYKKEIIKEIKENLIKDK